jgi:tetratricopeptide (TPR) repeat protein
LICALVTLGAAPGDTPTTWQPELTHSYEQALAKLASNDFTGALNSLLELESRASASLTSSSLLELDELEMKAIESLLPAGTEILLPVIVLHQEAYRQLRQQYLDTSAFRSRSMAMKLSDLYAELEPRRETATIASDLFASLAGLFRETSAGSTGLDLFRRSLTYDRTNEAALLGTAVAYEQRAMYKEALSFLKRCLEVHPENTEAQLRLAINLDRLGQHAQAIGTLEALLTREAPDWQMSLAYQELTRMLLARDKLLGAEAMAQRGLERFPRDSTLRISWF